MIDETPLRAVLSLARTGSFKTSAREMDMSNATFSRVIRKAEVSLGVDLVDRARSGSRLTAQGRAFVPLAERLLQDLTRFQRSTQAMVEGGGEELVIGCGPLTTRKLVAPVVTGMLSENPGLRCKVAVSADKQPIAQLEKGEIDIFLGDLTHTPWTEQIEIHVLARRPVVFVTGRHHALQSGGPHRLGDILRRYPLGAPYLHNHWQSTLTLALGGDQEAAEIARRLPQVQCDDYALLATLCKDSDLVVGGMAENFAEHVAQGTLCHLRLQRTLQWNICIARRVGDNRPAQDEFWNKVLALDAAYAASTTSAPQIA